ncbi:MAG: low affinity iron permease family protein [Candidatus Saccharimonadales bacterium]
MKDLFRRIANRISNWTGTATVFLSAVFIIIIWAATGPIFHFSDTWQLVINTGTTIITFLMVFLIQNTQNRDGKAVQLKLDELIHATKGARTSFVGLEDFSDEDLKELDNEFKLLIQNPSTARSIAKLHAKIDAEHARRQSLKIGGNSMLHIFHHDSAPTAPKPPEAS